MRCRLAIALVMTVAVDAVDGLAQRPPRQAVQRGTGSISGRVLNAKSEPLGNVVVRIGGRGTDGSLTATTDAEGFYQIADLADGDYTLHIFDPLYLRTCYGATDPFQLACATVAVSRDQHRSGIDFRLTMAALIRGRVVDSDGRGVAGANVHASQDSSAATLPAIASTQKDGTFEIANLGAGDTVLSVDLPLMPDRPRSPIIHYPGVARLDEAERIRVSEGLVTSGIMFVIPNMANRLMTARISVPATGATALSAWVYRVDPRMTRQISLDADGTGSVRGLLEGRYFVAARGQGDNGPLVAFEVVDLRHDAVDIAFLLQEPGCITGRVVAPRGGLPPMSGVRVMAKWTDDGMEIDPLEVNEADVGLDGSFRINGLFGRRTLELTGLPPDWRIQSIRQGRSEVLTSGVDVTANIVVTITVARP